MFKVYNKKTSMNRSQSRYVQGGDSDVTESGNKIAWWERRKLSDDGNDFTIKIDNNTQYRPDMIASLYLGDVELEWIILQYNNIVDVNEEFGAGAHIRIPSMSYVYTALLNKVSLL